MFRKYRKTIIITIIVTLLPILIGLLLWNRLPDRIATHFDMQNNPNGWSSKEMAVFGIPSFLAVFQLIFVFICGADPKYKNIGEKPLRFILWIIPVCSFLCTVLCYLNAMEIPVNIGLVVCIFIGIPVLMSYLYYRKHQKED